ncbi:MAG TPA: aldo/keto reductase [Candidatus Dormibacteraeota bacterium]|nr:aldo/keto reductase [Candidatus Dormibacteraeota bacterium]
MEQRVIGTRRVGAIGLGAMPLSIEDRPDQAQAVRTIHAALDAGVTLIDTANAYHEGAGERGQNERLVGAALRSWPGGGDGILVATKGGHVRPGDGRWEVDGRPEALRAACEASLRDLGVEAIGLYQFHRPDPRVPFEESVGALRTLQDEGKIVMAGLSNVTVAQIDSARRILEIASVQNEFSPRFRSSLGELRHCARLGVAFLPWSPLGGSGAAAELGRRHPAFAAVAAARGASPQQVALAWELAQGPVVIPIPGARRPETILDSVQAAGLTLTAAELGRLDAEA